MNVVVQHIESKLYLTRQGAWVALEAEPALFKDPVTVLSFCIQRGIRSVRLVGNVHSAGNERFIYPFGGDPVIKAAKKSLRRSLAQSRRFKQQKRTALQHLNTVRAEAKERKKQFPFKRNAVSDSAAIVKPGMPPG